ncbi:MAG: hypothetical protein CMD14_00385 [Flavobacteriales bacterium]|nr:hypothetical protein [Flavobacteriales bacterium]|tara:strand:+ start:3851 stop:4708 length:858 start_codon:yes stop_codon:yes gene_type:complete
MKQIILPFLLIFCLNAISQNINSPTIPAEGITMEFDQIDDTISISSTGPWDFSSIITTSNYSMSVLPIDSSIHSNNYPNATHVLKSLNGEFFFSYSSSQFLSYGKVGNTTTTNYTTPLLLMNYPFDSSVSHEDSINSTVLWNGLTAPLTEKIEILGVATGSITMPDGHFYEDAVLLTTKKTTVNGPDPIFGNYLTIEEISKQFWLPDYPLPSIEVLHAYSNSNLVLKRTLFMKGNTTTNFLESISNSKKKVIKKIDFLGRESSQINQPLFYLYDDGTVEKIITIE